MEESSFYAKTLAVLPEALAQPLRGLGLEQRQQAQEIRLRIHRPLSVVVRGQSFFMTRDGRAHPQPQPGSLVVTRDLLEETFLRLCGYAVHSHQRELARGFVTTGQGDRAGICASGVVGSDGSVSYRDISSINLRIAREALGSASALLRQLNPRRGVLLAGVPSSGKTTLLRDAIRAMAAGECGSYLKVAVVDERYELSAAWQGSPLYDLGLCSDVICGQSKAFAIEQAVRTLSPDMIACDEIGSGAEIAQLEAGLCSGVGFFATVHCGSPGELFASGRIASLMATGAFGYVVLLDSPARPGQASQIYTREEYHAQVAGTFVAL